MFAKELIDAVTDQLAHGATDVALVNEVPWGMLILQQDVRRLRDVARDSAVERVKISGFRIADEVTAIELGSFLTDHATLKSVDLSYSMLGSYAATVFSDISTMAISHLNLSCAGINVKAITDLALKLDSVSSSLRSLLLPYNAITLQGLGILLKWGCGLTSVDARYCGMLTGAGEKLDFLTEGLLENTSCASLLLSGNGFAPSDQALLRQTARGNRRSGLNRPGAVVFSDVSMKDVIVPDLLEEMRVQNEKQQEVIRRAGLTSEGTADWPLDLPSQAAPHRELAPVFEDIERLNCAPRVVSAPTARDAALFGAASCDNSPSSRALSGSYGSTRTIHSRIVEATRLLQNAGSNSDDASSSRATSNATTPMGDLQTTSFTRLHSSLSDSTLSFTRGTQSSQNRLKAADEYDDKGHLMGRIPASKGYEAARVDENRQARALLKMHKKLEDNVGKRNRHSFSAIRSRSATRYPPSVEVDTSSSNVFTTSQRSIRSQSLSCFERRPWNSGPFALNDNRLDKPAPVNVKDHVLKYYSRPERLLYRVQQQPDDHEPRLTSKCLLTLHVAISALDLYTDEVAQAEREKHARMAEFDRKMEEHEMMTIQSVLQRQNKVSIDSEEYKELQMLQVKENKEEQERKKRKFDDELEERAKTELRLKELEFAKKMAEARAQETSFATERNMLYMTIEGLRAEIESQKALTSELAASR
eukprot:gene10381-15985_t